MSIKQGEETLPNGLLNSTQLMTELMSWKINLRGLLRIQWKCLKRTMRKEKAKTHGALTQKFMHLHWSKWSREWRGINNQRNNRRKTSRVEKRGIIWLNTSSTSWIGWTKLNPHETPWQHFRNHSLYCRRIREIPVCLGLWDCCYFSTLTPEITLLYSVLKV